MAKKVEKKENLSELSASELQARLKELGGYVPQRKVRSQPLLPTGEQLFDEFFTGSEGREVSTTMAFVSMLRKMLRDPEIGKLIVPIVPDEARTFGMESLFRLVGIYSSRGQLYEPVDSDNVLYYREAIDGQTDGQTPVQVDAASKAGAVRQRASPPRSAEGRRHEPPADDGSPFRATADDGLRVVLAVGHGRRDGLGEGRAADED